jgi:hypothetical protein
MLYEIKQIAEPLRKPATCAILFCVIALNAQPHQLIKDRCGDGWEL